MRTPGRVASVLVVAALLAGCSRGTGGTDPASAPSRPPAPDAAAEPLAPAPAAPPIRRSVRLASAGWGFDVDAATTGGSTRIDVLVRPATAGAAPERLTLDLDGTLAEAFATDLDRDAAPELLLWTRSAGSSAEGQVHGWRFDAHGNAAALPSPPLDGEEAIGWRGRDQFGVQDDALVRSFPLYRDDDDNAHPSAGFVRVIRYRLEAARWVVANASLEPMDGTPQSDLLAR